MNVNLSVPLTPASHAAPPASHTAACGSKNKERRGRSEEPGARASPQEEKTEQGTVLTPPCTRQAGNARASKSHFLFCMFSSLFLPFAALLASSISFSHPPPLTHLSAVTPLLVFCGGGGERGELPML